MSERAVLFIVMATSFLAPFMASSLNLALPAIGLQFSADPGRLSWLASSHLLGSAAFLLPFGRLADIIGRKKVYLCGIALFSLTSLLSGFAATMNWLLLLRAVHGIVSAMIFSTGMAILTAVFAPSRRGYAIGMSSAATYVGLSFGPVLGGFLTDHFGWRSLFFVTAALSAAIAAFAAVRLRGEWRNACNERFDWLGMLSYLSSITLMLSGLSMVATQRGAGTMVLTGFLLLLFFLRYESRQQQPLFPVELFRHNRLFSFSNLAALINYSATFAVSFLLSLHLQMLRHLDASQAGLILLALPLCMAAFSPLSGRLSDRIQPAILASCGMGLSAIGLLLFIFLRIDTPLALLIAILALSGLGFALFSSPNTHAVMSSVDQTQYGIAASTLATMRLIGQALSMAIVTLLLSSPVASTQADALLLSGSRNAFSVFAILCSGGIFASLARVRRKRR